MNYLKNYLDKKNNNYTVIRLLLACLVLFGHSFALTREVPGINDPFQKIIGDGEWTGSVAVNIFFFISGLLITSSYVRRNNLGNYIQARIFRIYPAYIICAFLGTMFVGGTFTTLALTKYFKNPETAGYLISNLLLWKPLFFLPGVFEQIRNHSINGSVWTLPGELRCYVLVGILGVLGILKSPLKANATIFFLLVLGFYNFNLVPMLSDNSMNLKPALYFTIGVLCFINAKYIPLNWYIYIPIIGLYAISLHSKWNLVFMPLLLCYGTILIAYKTKYLFANSYGDFSYGVYIYAFPVQQVFVALLPNWNAYQNFIVSLPTTLLLGVASWFIIEKNCIVASHRNSEY